MGKELQQTMLLLELIRHRKILLSLLNVIVLLAEEYLLQIGELEW